MRIGSLIAAGLILGIAGIAGQVNAQSITYTFDGTISGDLINGMTDTPLTNVPFTFTLTGTTAGVGFSMGANFSSAAIANVTLGGIGSGVTTDPVNVFQVFVPQVVGLIDVNADAGFLTEFPSIPSSYLLKTSVGPVTNDPSQIDASTVPLPTSLGGILFSGFSGTFTSITSVPEPSAYALVASLGFSGVSLLRRRRAR